MSSRQPENHLTRRHPGRLDRRRPLAFGVLVVFLLSLANPCIHCFAMASTAEVVIVVAPVLADIPAEPEPASSSEHCNEPGNCCLGPGALPPTSQNLDLLQTLAVLAPVGIFIEMPLPTLQVAVPIASVEHTPTPPAFPLPLRI